MGNRDPHSFLNRVPCLKMKPTPFIDRLLTLEYDYWNSFKTRITKQRISRMRGTLPGLERIAICLTETCNFRCAYCNKKGNKEMDLGMIIKLLEASSSLGARYLSLTGGEATAYNNLTQVIQEGNKKGFSIVISTNGSFGDSLLKTFIASELAGVNISLDAVNPETHDELVGVKNSWSRIVHNISELSKRKHVWVNSMVTNKNYTDIGERLAGFAKLFPSIIDVQLIAPRNYPRGYLNQLQIDTFYNLIKTIDSDVLKRFPMAALKLPLLFGFDDKSNNQASKGIYCFPVDVTPCYLTLEELHFAPRGVYNCVLLQREFEQPLMGLEDFLSDPKQKFKQIQQRVLASIPFAKKCSTACNLEFSAFNHYVNNFENAQHT